MQHVNMFMIAPLEMQAHVCERIKLIFIHNENMMKHNQRNIWALNMIVEWKVDEKRINFISKARFQFRVVDGAFPQSIISFPSSIFRHLHPTRGN